jgi:hypothetical protein
MAINHNNLGHKVTTRSVSFGQLAQEAWGAEWGKRDVVYEFSNGASRLDDDNTLYGIYGVPLVTGIVLSQSRLYDGLQLRIMTELGQMIGVDNVGYEQAPLSTIPLLFIDNNHQGDVSLLTSLQQRIGYDLNSVVVTPVLTSRVMVDNGMTSTQYIFNHAGSAITYDAPITPSFKLAVDNRNVSNSFIMTESGQTITFAPYDSNSFKLAANNGSTSNSFIMAQSGLIISYNH